MRRMKTMAPTLVLAGLLLPGIAQALPTDPRDVPATEAEPEVRTEEESSAQLFAPE